MKEQARQKIGALVDRFRTNIDVYKRSAYKEAQVRREFIDPFFEALGWDVSNKQGFAEQYKEVVLEDTIKIGLSTRAPDYSFRIGSQRKFFVEAKKPAVNIKDDVSPSYQLRRYAWSAKLPLSIVTDFEEFSVFNCQMKPNQNDKVGIGRIAYYTFDEYLDKFDAIYDIFSKEAVLKGSFDRYAQSTKGKKGTAAVDREFLKEIESWREMLAKNIALRNPNVSIYELNYAVQKIIDRIIFLRICEDRGIEPYGQLQTQAEAGDVYMHLLNHFRLAESKYDSGIFNFDFGGDGITPALTIDDKVLKTIIQALYYPKSPYEFSVLGVEILGNVYEQFLGKVIRLTAGHQAKVETKPEVKKAGGVYYTPQYIVEYIVENTVGKLIAGKTPEEIAHIKILDPACGSGSFLIGAYNYLLRYHRDWYVGNKPKKHKGKMFQAKANEWYLTTAEKKRILLDNVFGVDIDSQAVEVTKMSLLLKVLEHESRESIDQQMKLGLEGVLPNLGDNIKCGNSLIGPEYYELGQQGTLFDEEEMRRVNVFDWNDDKKGFGGIMKKGGFDCVVGNPPYVRPHRLDPQIKEYFWQHYTSFVKKSDLYCCFIERCVSLLKPEGGFGFIVSNGWMRLDSFENLRAFLLNTTSLRKMIEFTYNVFDQATVKTTILLLSKGTKQDNVFEVATSDKAVDLEQLIFKKLPQDTFRRTYKLIFDLSIDEIQERIKQTIRRHGIELGNAFKLSFGLKTGDDSKFLSHSQATVDHKPLLRGKDIHRYFFTFDSEFVWYVPTKMRAHRKTARPGTADRFEQPKVLIRDTGNALQGTFDDEHYYVKDVLVVLDADRNAQKLKFLIGLLNSRLMKFYYETSFPTLHVQRDELASLPIRTIDFDDPAEKALHDKLVALVDNMLELQKKHHDARMERDKELYERQIKMVDAQIDRLVYDLYGLTEEEIKVVEGK